MWLLGRLRGPHAAFAGGQRADVLRLIGIAVVKFLKREVITSLRALSVPPPPPSPLPPAHLCGASFWLLLRTSGRHNVRNAPGLCLDWDPGVSSTFLARRLCLQLHLRMQMKSEIHSPAEFPSLGAPGIPGLQSACAPSPVRSIMQWDFAAPKCHLSR